MCDKINQKKGFKVTNGKKKMKEKRLSISVKKQSKRQKHFIKTLKG